VRPHRLRHPLPRRGALRLGLATSAAALLAACKAPTRVPPDSPAVTLITRAEWGAVEPNMDAATERGVFNRVTNRGGWLEYDQPLDQVLTTLVVHHSASVLDGPRDIQKLHMEKRGYADIGYHYLIEAGGRLYEGRALNVRGAHTGGFNTGTVGVCLLGNFENQWPAMEQLQTLRSLGTSLVAAYGLTHLAGHNSFQPGATVCPGHNLEPLLPDLAGVMGLVYGTAGYVPPAWS
jgi:hypothetical protein